LSHEIQIGQVLDNRLEITALVEHTDMGMVFKAVDRQTSQIVALKLPHIHFDGTARNAARFAREAAIMRMLDHPGLLKIVPIPEKCRTYIVMEYLEGKTIRDILERTRPIPVTGALRLGSRVCEILDYVHRHGVVHCDLKPANIMISDDGAPHIIDFGIAKGRRCRVGSLY
jgi:serine/threonine protein kinase